MKKLLMGSAILMMFSMSLFFFQMSCTKGSTAEPQENNSTKPTQAGKIIFTQNEDYSGTNSEIWIANYDGSNPTKVDIQLPQDVVLDGYSGVMISPDGKKIFFVGYNNESNQINSVYSCDIDGGNVKEIFKGGIASDGYHFTIIPGQAY